MEPGRFSSIGAGLAAIKNIAIAFDTIIENARGGSGSDVLIGNHVANKLEGKGGADRLDGGTARNAGTGGANAEQGDGMADTLIGGDGTDTYVLREGGGKDIIVDTGVNKIEVRYLDGTSKPFNNLTGFKNVSGTWTSPDGKFTFTRNSPVTIKEEATGIEVQIGESTDAFTNGDFGIRLKPAPTVFTAPTTSTEINGGDLCDADTSRDGIQIQLDATGVNAVVIAGTLEADVANILAGTAASDYLFADLNRIPVNPGWGIEHFQNQTVASLQADEIINTGRYLQAPTDRTFVGAGAMGQNGDASQGHMVYGGGGDDFGDGGDDSEREALDGRTGHGHWIVHAGDGTGARHVPRAAPCGRAKRRYQSRFQSIYSLRVARTNDLERSVG